MASSEIKMNISTVVAGRPAVVRENWDTKFEGPLLKVLVHAINETCFAVVEYENGMLGRCPIDFIKFVDSEIQFAEYAWPRGMK